MMIFRLVFGLLLVSGLLCFATYIATGNAVWRKRGIVVVKWTVIAGLGFFAVIALERLAPLLLEAGLGDRLWIIGGNLPAADHDALRALGFEGVFATGSKLDAITTFISEHLR